MKKVLILSGPGGTGKTTIAKLLSKRFGFFRLDGDREDSEFFPNGKQWLSKNSKKLQKAHNKILQRTKELVQRDKIVIVDYIIFGDYLNFFEKFKKTFGKHLEIRILFPDVEECVKRDLRRRCWTTGRKRIEAVYSDFKKIKNKIGVDKFIDTSGQTPAETVEKYFKFLVLKK